jgi:methyl-accepting chemotaxis protein
MGIATLDGSLTSSNGSVSNIKEREYFKDALSGKPAVSDPIISKVDGSVIVMYAVPIKNNGQINGVLVATRDGNNLSDITDKLIYGQTGYSFMISKSGVKVAHKNRELVTKMDNDFENVKEDPKLATLVALEQKMVDGETGFGFYHYNGFDKYSGYAPVEGTNWALGITAPKTEVMKNVNHLRDITLILSLLVLIIGIFVAWFDARIIVKPLINVVGKIEEIAGGNLAIEKAKITTKDEIGVLGNAVNSMLDGLRTLVKTVSGMAEQVSGASEELTASAQQQAQAAGEVASVAAGLAQGAEKQAAAVDGISAAVEENSAMMEQMSATSTVVAQQTKETALAASEGQKAVRRAVNQMKNVGEGAGRIQAEIKKLAQSSREIDEIINVISGIAEQTNLLALNAAIEAARAGEHGKGFAVVAEEVRKLAEQSQTATKQIAELIVQNQANIDDVVDAMESGSKDVITGIEVVNAAGQAFEEIADLANKVSSQVEEMAIAVQQMAKGTETIVHSIKDVDAISKQNMAATQTVSAASQEQTASVEEIASASQVLATMAEDLQASIRKFRL